MRLERKKCKADFLYFTQSVLGYKDLVADVHHDIADKLSSDFTRGLIMIPRKHLKTCQITVGWTIWMWLKNPNIRIGIGSATGELAKSIVSEIKAHISTNPKFIELFGNWTDKQHWTSTSFNIAPRTKISKDKSLNTFSVGKDATGQHYDVIILDDLAIRKNSGSALQRENQINLYKDCLDLIVKDETKGIIVMVGTRWHFGDVYNYVIEKNRKSKAFDFIIDEPCLRNKTLEEKNPEGWRRQIKDLMTHPDTKLLFPQMFDLKWAKETYSEKGTYEFSCQQMNFPTSDESAAFKPEDLEFCKISEVPAGMQKIMLVDPAGDDSTYERSDYWAAVVVGIVPTMHDNKLVSRIYVLDVIVESKISSNLFLEKMAALDAKHGVGRIVIEKNFAKTYINVFREKYPHLQHKVKALTASNQKTKTGKILGLQPYTENHNLVIVEENEDIASNEYPFIGRTLLLNKGKKELIDELVDFGNAEHDDAADALSMVLEVFRPAKQKTNRTEYTWKTRNSKTGY